jgi:NIPSNAP
LKSKEDHVLVDVRTYRVRPGKLPQELDLYVKYGLGPQTRHLGPPVAYLQAESGDLNTLVHLWAFEDAGDRARRRGAMMSDPEWQNYLKLADKAGFLVEQHNSLMVPASFAPIKR